MSGHSPQRRRRQRWRSPTRRWLDSAFPTVVRYGGFLLMGYAALIDRGQNPALIPAATGMIFFKSVYSGYSGGGKD